ncbi:lanthionine synthetase LanC family protein [Bradyrhizobium sp. SZCCHNS3002]|uniref:lanthionine synthetase LanC family protein n=1 Tax=Bradyrhizobium sp. SZCCHNS3002 TaxID=3057310 RepID=UPI0028E4EDED|nr:lanthionine synthetase LanC family protein [Bradyrhizobium sp. SZCCHNS3002]
MYETRSGYVPSHKTLGPSVYNGTAGIALFLAEASQFLESKDLLATAKGAMLQAIANRNQILPENEMSFYTGLVGLLFVAQYIHALVRDRQIEQEIEPLIGTILAKDVSKCALDQIHGVASAVPFLIAMDRAGILVGGIHKAISITDYLATRLEPAITGHAWKEANSGTPDGIPLSCFSHGTSGLVWPLIEATAAGVGPGFEREIQSVFRYEDAFWCEKEGNWYDLRGVTERSLPSAKYGRFAGHWCHGNVGIFLVRRRAHALGLDARHGPSLARMAEGVNRTVGVAIENGENFSICHGLLGDIEAVESAGAVERVFALSNDRAENLAWHYGLNGKPAPDLFLGISGIGRAHLKRLGGVGFSVLLPLPDAVQDTLSALLPA